MNRIKDDCILISLAALISVRIAAAENPSVVGKDLIEIKRGHVPSYPRVIQGKITDTNGKPVIGALIEWGPDYPDNALRESTLSEEDGTYRLEVEKAGAHFQLGISATSFSPQWTQLIPGPRSAPTERDFVLSQETVIEVTIVDESGVAIPHLEVTAMTPQSGFYSSFSTVQQPRPIPGYDKPVVCTAEGSCELRQLLPAPVSPTADDAKLQLKYREHFEKQGWLSLKITQYGKWVHEHQISNKEYFNSKGKLRIVLPNFRDPLVAMLHTGTIYGRVVDPEGHSVDQYRVTVRHRAEPTEVSNADGRFQWGGRLDLQKTYEVRIFADDFAPQIVKIKPELTTEERPKTIQLARHPSARFQLVDQQSGKPIPNAGVVSGISTKSVRNYIEWNNLKNYADGYHSLENVLHLTSDDNGFVTIPEGVEPTTLIILNSGYGRKIVTPATRPAPDASGVIQIPLPAAAMIHAVSSVDSPLCRQSSGIYLQYHPTDGIEHMDSGFALDESGECLIDSLAAGVYTVGLKHSDGQWSTASWTKMITLTAGQQIKLTLGEMTGSLTLSGRTSPFNRVCFSRDDGLSSPESPDANEDQLVSLFAMIADVDGYFEFDHVEPGTYKIELGIGGQRHVNHALPPNGRRLTEIRLSTDTHIDFEAGTIVPLEAAIKTPAQAKWITDVIGPEKRK